MLNPLPNPAPSDLNVILNEREVATNAVGFVIDVHDS